MTLSLSWTGWPSYQDYLAARRRYATLTPKLYNGQLAGFTVDMPGIVGGGSRATMTYRVYVTLVNSPAHPPDAWMTYPQDHLIRHCNVWHPGGGSPQVRLELPFVCLGHFADNWNSGRLGRATNFLSFLDQVYTVLNNENPDSPAR